MSNKIDMDETIITQICQQIYTQFPLLKEIPPEIKSQPHENVLLIFKGSGTTQDGHMIPFIVRVVADKTGKILKTTTSR